MHRYTRAINVVIIYIFMHVLRDPSTAGSHQPIYGTLNKQFATPPQSTAALI
jgi:hypothetical protein